MREPNGLTHRFDLADLRVAEATSSTTFFAEESEDEKAIDTFGTMMSAGTFGGCFGCFGTAGCCC